MSYTQKIDIILNGTEKIRQLEGAISAADSAALSLKASIESIGEGIQNTSQIIKGVLKVERDIQGLIKGQQIPRTPDGRRFAGGEVRAAFERRKKRRLEMRREAEEFKNSLIEEVKTLRASLEQQRKILAENQSKSAKLRESKKNLPRESLAARNQLVTDLRREEIINRFRGRISEFNRKGRGSRLPQDLRDQAKEIQEAFKKALKLPGETLREQQANIRIIDRLSQAFEQLNRRQNELRRNENSRSSIFNRSIKAQERIQELERTGVISQKRAAQLRKSAVRAQEVGVGGSDFGAGLSIVKEVEQSIQRIERARKRSLKIASEDIVDQRAFNTLDALERKINSVINRGGNRDVFSGLFDELDKLRNFVGTKNIDEYRKSVEKIRGEIDRLAQSEKDRLQKNKTALAEAADRGRVLNSGSVLESKIRYLQAVGAITPDAGAEASGRARGAISAAGSGDIGNAKRLLAEAQDFISAQEKQFFYAEKIDKLEKKRVETQSKLASAQDNYTSRTGRYLDVLDSGTKDLDNWVKNVLDLEQSVTSFVSGNKKALADFDAELSRRTRAKKSATTRRQIIADVASGGKRVTSLLDSGAITKEFARSIRGSLISIGKSARTSGAMPEDLRSNLSGVLSRLKGISVPSSPGRLINSVAATGSRLTSLIESNAVPDGLIKPLREALIDIGREARNASTPLEDLSERLGVIRNRLSTFKKPSDSSDLDQLLRNVESGKKASARYLGGTTEEAIDKIVRTFNKTAGSGRAANAGMDAIGNISSKIVGRIGQVASSGASIGANLIDTFSSEVKSSASKIAASGTAIADKFKSSVKKAFGIASPSRFMLEIVRNLIETYISELERNYPRIQAATQKAFGELTIKRDVRQLFGTSKGFEFASRPSTGFRALPQSATGSGASREGRSILIDTFREQIGNLTTQPFIYKNLLRAIPERSITTRLAGLASQRAMMAEIPSFMSTQRMIGPGALEKEIQKIYAEFIKSIRATNPWIGPAGDYSKFIDSVVTSTRRLVDQAEAVRRDQLVLPEARIAGALPPIGGSSAPITREERIARAYRRSADRASTVIQDDALALANRIIGIGSTSSAIGARPIFVTGGSSTGFQMGQQTGVASSSPLFSRTGQQPGSWSFSNGFAGGSQGASAAATAAATNAATTAARTAATAAAGAAAGAAARAAQTGAGMNASPGLAAINDAAEQGARALLTLADLADPARMSLNNIELLSQALTNVRGAIDSTDANFGQLDRQLRRTIGNLEDQRARRDPSADFLTRRFGRRGGAAISEGLIGGAFPLLFGQGLGASVGGLVGGAVGGAAGGMLGFGLSLAGTAIGSAVDTTIQNLKDLAGALKSPAETMAALEASGFRVRDSLKLQVDQLQAVGRAYDAQTLVLQEVQKRLGPGSLTELSQLDAAQKKLQEQYNAIASEIQVRFLPVLQGFLEFLGGAAGNLSGFASQSRLQRLDPEKLNQLRDQAIKETDRGPFGGEGAGKAYNARLDELARQELSKRFANERAQIKLSPQEALAAETTQIQESRKIADQIQSAYREALDLQRKAYDLQREGADINREIADYSYKKEREIVDLRQQAAEAAINNARAAAQNRIERSDLNAREVFASAVGFEQQLLTNVREVMRTRKEGEADIEQSRRKLELTLAKLNRDVEDYKRTTAREIDDIERRKLAYTRSVEDYKMQVADYVLERARQAADLMRQAMTLPDMGGAGGAIGGLASAIDRIGGAYQFRGVTAQGAKKPDDYQSDPRENFFFDRRPQLIDKAKTRISSLTQKDLAALAFTVLTEAGPTDIGKMDVAANLLVRSANLGNAPISAVAKQPGQYIGVNRYSRNDLESEARGRQVFGSSYDRVLSLIRGGIVGGMGGGGSLPGSISGRLDASGQNGADMPVAANNAIRSYHNGIVTAIDRAGRNGNYAVIEFIDDLGNKLEATYSHMTSMVGVGQRVVGGQIIGRYDGSGRSSGPHNSIDINSPGTNGALQRNRETAAARRSADILVTGRVQGAAGSSLQAMGATQITGAATQPVFNPVPIGATPVAAPLNRDRLEVLARMTGNEREAQRILEEQIKLKEKGVELGQLEQILQNNQLPQLQQQGKVLQSQIETRKKILDLSDNAASVTDIEAEAAARIAQIEKDRANAIAKVQKQYPGDAKSIEIINNQSKLAIDIARKEEEQRLKNLKLSNELEGLERARTEIVQLQENIAIGKAEAAALELGKLQASNIELLKARLLYKQASDEQKKTLETLTRQDEQQRNVNSLQGEYNNKLKDAKTRISELYAGADGLTEYQKAIGEIAAKGIENDNGQADNIIKTAKAVDLLNQKAKQLEKIKQIAGAWTDAFVNFNAELLKTGNLTEALQKWGEDIGSKAVDMLLEITMRPIQDEIFKKIADFLGFEQPQDPMLQPLNNMDGNIRSIKDDVAAIRVGGTDKMQLISQTSATTAAANNIQPLGPGITAASDSVSLAPAQVTTALESDATLKAVSSIVNLGMAATTTAAQITNLGSGTAAATQQTVANAAANQTATAATSAATRKAEGMGNTVEKVSKQEEEKMIKLKEYGKVLGTGIQVLGGIAMGIAGVQQMKKGGTYNVLMGLAGIFGSISQTSFGFGKLFGVKGFAEGGRPPVNKPSWVGERGPELWWPDRAGTIIPMDQLYIPGQSIRGYTSDDSQESDGNTSASDAGSSDTLFYATRAALSKESANTTATQQDMQIQQPAAIDVRYESTVINNVEYVTVEQHRRGMQEAAKMGQALAYKGLQSSVQTRKRIGM